MELGYLFRFVAQIQYVYVLFKSVGRHCLDQGTMRLSYALRYKRSLIKKNGNHICYYSSTTLINFVAGSKIDKIILRDFVELHWSTLFWWSLLLILAFKSCSGLGTAWRVQSQVKKNPLHVFFLFLYFCVKYYTYLFSH